jgi:hypothetical protein
MSDELVVGVEPAALDVRAVPDCPPGSSALARSSRVINGQTWSARRRFRQRIASLWVFPAAILVRLFQPRTEYYDPPAQQAAVSDSFGVTTRYWRLILDQGRRSLKRLRKNER